MWHSCSPQSEIFLLLLARLTPEKLGLRANSIVMLHVSCLVAASANRANIQLVWTLPAKIVNGSDLFQWGKWGNCLNDYKSWMVGDLLGIWRHKTSFLPWNDCWRNLTQQGQWVMMINRKDSACYFSKCFWKVIKEEKAMLVLRAKKWKVISDKMGGKIFQFMGSQKQHPIHRKKMNTCHNYLD